MIQILMLQIVFNALILLILQMDSVSEFQNSNSDTESNIYTIKIHSIEKD